MHARPDSDGIVVLGALGLEKAVWSARTRLRICDAL
jgi:hypothetical protein